MYSVSHETNYVSILDFFVVAAYSVSKETYLLSNEAFSVGKCDVFRVT